MPLFKVGSAIEVSHVFDMLTVNEWTNVFNEKQVCLIVETDNC